MHPSSHASSATLLSNAGCALASLALCAALSGQTYIVDANNGPGTSFTSIAAAVAAVPDGATLLVRPGSYQAFLVHQKGLSIRADPGAIVIGTARIENTLPTQNSVLTGFTFVQPPSLPYGVMLADCQGLVVVERVTMPTTVVPMPLFAGYSVFPVAMGVARCVQVVLRGSQVTRLSVQDSNAVIEGCLLRGNDGTMVAGFPCFATEGLNVGNGRVQVAGATLVRGGDSGTAANGQPGVGMQVVLADVRVLDGAIQSGLGGIGSWAASIAVSTLRIDPRVVIQASHFQIFSGTPVFSAMPQVTSTSAPPGGTIHAEVATSNGDLVLLCVAWPGPPLPISGLPVDVWLNLGSIGACTAGLQQAGAPVSADLAIPNLPGLAGTVLALQALAWNATNGLSISNPSLPMVD